MAKWRKPRCSVCGKTLDEHPAKPCKKGISPRLVQEQIQQEEFLARRAKRQLNTKTRKPKGPKYIKQLYTSKKLGKKNHKRPTSLRQKHKPSTKRAHTRKRRVYN